MTTIKEAQRFLRALQAAPPKVRKALSILLVDSPPEVQAAFMTIVHWQHERR